jgi:hypothetical protein
MSFTKEYDFLTPTDYSYDTNAIEIIDGVGKLKLQIGAAPFTQNFISDTEFTYDNTKAEFAASICRQKDQRPVSASFGAKFNSIINTNWSDGVGTGTAYGGAAIAGGVLDLTGGVQKYVTFAAAGNAPWQQTLTVKFKYIPNYSGIPAQDQYPFAIGGTTTDDSNSAAFFHSAGGNLTLRVCNSLGNYIIPNYSLGAWSPVAGTEYEFEFDMDLTTGATRLFLNGTQYGTTATQTGARTSSINYLRVGNLTAAGSRIPNFKIKDFIVYSTVQHTANYTPGYTVPEYIYIETSVTCPELEHTGDGSIRSFNSFVTTESNAPRYTLQIGRSGNYLYWNGSSWVTSDGSYAQSNSQLDFNAHCASMPVIGEKYGQFKVIFQAGNSQSSITSLTANMTVNIGYLTTNPIIQPIDYFRSDALENFLITAIIIGDDLIKYALKKGTVCYYWAGTAWAVSTSYAQSNTAAEILTHLNGFLSASSLCNVKIYLHSDDGTTTPQIDNVRFDYSYGGETPDSITTCIVWGWAKNTQGLPVQINVFARLNKDYAKYKSYTMAARNAITITSDSSGYWEIELIETVNMETGTKYIFNFDDTREYARSVPVETTKNFYDLL